ncbi:U3 small nucleolar RNA-associated protein NOL7-like [Haliotis cracherodii]|uniref:U3 small nucleolar RNA-associated protein NOL7-like n=1 Tax=Haliotis cracherodii TaxID=6455 RepID=UPI0039ED8107
MPSEFIVTNSRHSGTSLMETVSTGEGSSNDDEDLELAHDDVASDEDDSDAAPEDVGFSETRATALSQMRQAMTQIKEEKLQLKTKRKQRDEKFKEQKRIKLEAVSRLPDEILNSLPEKLSEEKKETDKEKKKHEDKNRVTIPLSKQSTVFEETEDYLPLKTGFVDSETGIKAMPLKDLRKRMAISQSAANFRNSRLYGDHRRRESN